MFFFFNDTETTEFYTLPLHDALPILVGGLVGLAPHGGFGIDAQQDENVGSENVPGVARLGRYEPAAEPTFSSCCASRSEEHTSELPSQANLVCRLLLGKKITHVHTMR